MKNIDADIQNHNLKHCYVLYGEELYLRKQYRDRLIEALGDREDTMNFSAFEGKDINEKEIIDLAETLPFFAERRVILLEQTGLLKKGGEDLADYLKEIPETTYFLFVEDEIDKRSKIYKAVAKTGYVAQFERQKEETLQKWVLSRLKKEEKGITRQAYQLFINKTGEDMENIAQELEKLLCYIDQRPVIQPEDVEAITSEQTQNKVFDMVDAITAHNQVKALDYYYDLLALKEPPMRILYLISKQFDQMLQVKRLMGKGLTDRDVAAKVGCPDWKAKQLNRQVRSFTAEQLEKAVEDGVAYEEAVKTGHMDDQMAVELFIVTYSAKAKETK